MLALSSHLMCYLHQTHKGGRQSLKVRGLSMLISSKPPGVQMPQQGKIVCAVRMQHGALSFHKAPQSMLPGVRLLLFCCGTGTSGESQGMETAPYCLLLHTAG